MLVCLYSLYSTHNAHWLGTAESHPELSFPESPKHCICTADMDLYCTDVLYSVELEKNVRCTIGQMWWPFLWSCMKTSLTCISAENIKGLMLCLAQSITRCAVLVFEVYFKTWIWRWITCDVLDVIPSACWKNVLRSASEGLLQVMMMVIWFITRPSWRSEWSFFRDVNLQSG